MTSKHGNNGCFIFNHEVHHPYTHSSLVYHSIPEDMLRDNVIDFHLRIDLHILPISIGEGNGGNDLIIRLYVVCLQQTVTRSLCIIDYQERYIIDRCNSAY